MLNYVQLICTYSVYSQCDTHTLTLYHLKCLVLKSVVYIGEFIYFYKERF